MFKFYDEEDEEDDAPTEVAPCPFEEVEDLPILSARVASPPPLPPPVPVAPPVNFMPVYSPPRPEPAPESFTAPAIALIVLGALLVAGVSILLTLIFTRPSAETRASGSPESASVSAALEPMSPIDSSQSNIGSPQAEPPSRVEGTETVEGTEAPPEDAREGAQVDGAAADDEALREAAIQEPEPAAARAPTRHSPSRELAAVLDAVTDQVRACAELGPSYSPRNIAVHLVPGEEQRITVGAISPQPPPHVGRCISRIIHRATWPSPRAFRPLVIHSFELSSAP